MTELAASASSPPPPQQAEPKSADASTDGCAPEDTSHSIGTTATSQSSPSLEGRGPSPLRMPVNANPDRLVAAPTEGPGAMELATSASLSPPPPEMEPNNADARADGCAPGDTSRSIGTTATGQSPSSLEGRGPSSLRTPINTAPDRLLAACALLLLSTSSSVTASARWPLSPMFTFLMSGICAAGLGALALVGRRFSEDLDFSTGSTYSWHAGQLTQRPATLRPAERAVLDRLRELAPPGVEIVVTQRSLTCPRARSVSTVNAALHRLHALGLIQLRPQARPTRVVVNP